MIKHNIHSFRHPFKEMILKFIEIAIKRINQSLAMNYATQQILMDAGIASKKELQEKISEALKLPKVKVGKEAIREMFGELSPKNKINKNVSKKIDNILEMINQEIPKENN